LPKRLKIRYALRWQTGRPGRNHQGPSVGERPPRDLSRHGAAEVVEPRYGRKLFTLIQAELRRSVSKT